LLFFRLPTRTYFQSDRSALTTNAYPLRGHGLQAIVEEAFRVDHEATDRKDDGARDAVLEPEQLVRIMVAPTGFEPVFPHRRTLLPAIQ
jgi:hypothetical protein